MAFVGMVVEEVRQTGNELKQISSEIQSLMNRLDSRVQSTTWQGPDAERFKGEWWPQHRSNLQRICADLEGLGQSAMNNAQEQEQASNA